MKDHTFHYVYILQSLTGGHFYTGITTDLETRLQSHNTASDPSTEKYRPWGIKTYTAFTNKTQALKFEKYLKSQSGRAFAKKRL